MVKYCLWLGFFISFNGLLAQNAFPAVRGQVVESTTGDPLASVNITLLQLPDSSALKTIPSDSLGNFFFEEIQNGSYYIEANLIGFTTAAIPGFTVTSSQTLIAEEIRMEASEFLLESIEVTADNPTVRQHDRS
ncbi:MAG: carboxypeptidase-like regulatory domain-containing protein [Saprospiraceae bacterium]